MKTVGIIGGLGPETTAKFYEHIIASTFLHNNKQRPPIIIWNVPMDYSIEDTFIKTALGSEKYLPYLIQGARVLESAGADFLVIPCNSVHIHINDVRKSAKIPVLSIVEETLSFLKAKGIKKVGLLATKATVQSNLYQIPLQESCIKVLTLSEEQQSLLGELISRLVLNQQNGKDKQQLLNLIESFKEKGIETILLACTDLQLLNPEVEGVTIYDTMEIFVEATVERLV